MRIALALVAAAVLLSGCGPSYVRGSEMPELDEYAMGTGLDKKDLEGLFEKNIHSLMGAPIMGMWRQQAGSGKTVAVAIFPIKNETTEHIDGALNTLLSKMETKLVNAGYLDVISYERQKALVKELRWQQNDAFNPSKAAQLGRQLGAHFFVTGKVYDNAERTKDERRVQYTLFMQVLSVETGALKWQNEASLTKGLVQ